MRKKSCVDHFVTICRRFDVYKKATNSLPHSEATKVIKVVKTPSKSDFILTTDEVSCFALERLRTVLSRM